jgi:two-component system OmpR family response regulator
MPTPPSEGRPPPGKSVLLVEDEDDTGVDVKQLLEEREYVVRCVGDGAKALDHLQHHPPPDLILLDPKLPVMDAGEFRVRQRLDPTLADIPVVVLSASGESARQDDTLGDVGYLQKPVAVQELFATVERFTTRPKPEVLVVEDEPAVRQCLAVVLRHYGFAVREAGSGERAVEVYERHRDTIAVVLLDVQMPGLDGPQTFALLRDINPAVRAVFMSGNTGVYSAEELLALGACHVLGKPFRSLDEFAGRLWQLATNAR